MRKIDSYEELIAWVRDGRAKFERAEVEWFLRLREVELSSMQIICDAGCETFARFLKSNKLCEPARYDAFCKGLARIDDETAREMGTDAVIRLCDVRDDAKVPEVVHAVAAWREEHGGVFPSNETSRTLVRQCDPREEVPKPVRNLSRVAMLEAELAKVRADLRAERAKTRRLEAELGKLKGRAAA